MSIVVKKTHGREHVSGSVHRKVKSGCRTCKRRKVKCDESRPACHRCQSTGRACDGYGIWGGGSQPTYLLSRQASAVVETRPEPATVDIVQLDLLCPVRLVLCEEDERHCFEWFMYRSAVKLPGVFGSHHWTTLLFQTSLTESATRHAMLMLASAHKEEVQGSGLFEEDYDNKQTRFTMSQYSKAIARLKPRFSDTRKESVRIACISCVLFVSTEFLRGHYTNGLLHLEHGLNLLLEYNMDTTCRGPSMTYIDGWLITIFTRHLVQAKLLGQVPTFQCRRMFRLLAQPLPNIFESTHHARRTLEHLMLRALDMKEQSDLSELNPCDPNNLTTILSLTAEQTTLEAELTQWFRTYTQTLAHLPSQTPYLERFAYTLLNLYYNLTALLAATCLTPSASSASIFDTQSTTFQSIIIQCLHINALVHPDNKPHDKPRPHPEVHHDPEPSSPNSVCDIGWLAPLYFTAVNCRVRRIRRVARRLLGLSVHREGIWSSGLIKVLVGKIVGIEEEKEEEEGICEHEDRRKHETENIPIIRSSIIPAERRVTSLTITLPDDRSGKLSMRCRRRCRTGAVVETEWITSEYNLRSGTWSDVVWKIADDSMLRLSLT